MSLPRQIQLILPLLEAADAAGGRIATRSVYDAVASSTGVSNAARAETALRGGRPTNRFEHNVRWAQQKARLDGLLRRVGPGDWEITGKGRSALRKATPGLVITLFVTDSGAALYGHAEDAVGLIDDQSLSLIFTSPPYPLVYKKAYGNESERAYVDWLMGIISTWPRKLTQSGSIVLNLGEAWNAGEPTLSLYQERLLVRLNDELGLKLCQRFQWHNPSKMPAPAEWVTVRRIRVKPSVEHLFWLSPNAFPHADNREVLTAYSASMERLLSKGGERAQRRPSGYDIRDSKFGARNGGSIPSTLISAANSSSSGAYMSGCRADGLPIHPARFPEALPEFFIKFLTGAGDTVFDPFGGSMTTGAVAERLGRRWISSEPCLEYIQGARHRFAA